MRSKEILATPDYRDDDGVWRVGRAFSRIRGSTVHLYDLLIRACPCASSEYRPSIMTVQRR